MLIDYTLSGGGKIIDEGIAPHERSSLRARVASGAVGCESFARLREMDEGALETILGQSARGKNRVGIVNERVDERLKRPRPFCQRICASLTGRSEVTRANGIPRVEIFSMMSVNLNFSAVVEV